MDTSLPNISINGRPHRASLVHYYFTNSLISQSTMIVGVQFQENLTFLQILLQNPNHFCYYFDGNQVILIQIDIYGFQTPYLITICVSNANQLKFSQASFFFLSFLHLFSLRQSFLSLIFFNFQCGWVLLSYNTIFSLLNIILQPFKVKRKKKK